jgi:hypothetical protein
MPFTNCWPCFTLFLVLIQFLVVLSPDHAKPCRTIGLLSGRGGSDRREAALIGVDE